MKKFNVILLLICLLFTFNIVSNTADAQSDSKAVKILDDAVSKLNSFKSLKIDFTFNIEDKSQKINENYSGTFTTKADKYKLQFGEQTIFCNGKTVWTYFKNANEVEITDLNSSEEPLTPISFIKNYKKEYKARFISDRNNIQVVELYPVAKEKTLIKATVTIDKPTKQIKNISIQNKDGSFNKYIIKTITPNTVASDNEFNFDKTKYPGVEIIDMR